MEALVSSPHILHLPTSFIQEMKLRRFPDQVFLDTAGQRSRCAGQSVRMYPCTLIRDSQQRSNRPQVDITQPITRWHGKIYEG